MYYRWLDHWDERRAQRGDELKQATDFVLNSESGFPKATKVTSIADFCDLADQAVIKFPSDLPTEIEDNNVV